MCFGLLDCRANRRVFLNFSGCDGGVLLTGADYGVVEQNNGVDKVTQTLTFYFYPSIQLQRRKINHQLFW